jgi:hypothetical protein
MAIPNELARRKEIGKKLATVRESIGLTPEKAMELIGRLSQAKQLRRIERPQANAKGKQAKNGATLDVLLLADLAALYKVHVGELLSPPKEKRLRNEAEVLAAAAASGIYSTDKGKRVFASVNGVIADAGSAFVRVMKKGLLSESPENGVTVYRPAKPGTAAPLPKAKPAGEKKNSARRG